MFNLTEKEIQNWNKMHEEFEKLLASEFLSCVDPIPLHQMLQSAREFKSWAEQQFK